MNKFLTIRQLFLLFTVFMALPSISFADLPTEADIQSQLKTAQSADQNDPNNKIVVQNLEETLNFLTRISQQKAEIKQLEDKINNAPSLTLKTQQHLDSLKKTVATSVDLTKLSTAEMQAKLTSAQQELQQIQNVLTTLNSDLTMIRTAPERAQATLNANLTRTQEINKALANSTLTSAEKVRLETELVFIELQNNFNKLALQGNNAITSLYSIQLEDKNLEQTQLQAQVAALQDAINQKYLDESKLQADQLTKQQDKTDVSNPLLAEQLELNVKLSQELVQQTTLMNTLSQDNIRIKNVLDNLQQTQRNIDDQISALQGTLVLSRIINKQKNLLPQDQMISGLSKRITDLRVKIFDVTEERDNLYDIQTYIANLEAKSKTTFTTAEKTQLGPVLQERRKLLSDIVNSLNNQLNLAITIELNQKQVTAISDELQGKLQQQSFWVRSNAPIDLDWFANFLPALQLELTEIVKLIDFSNWRNDFISTGALIVVLLAVAFFIRSQKQKIGKHLQEIAKRVNTLNSDSHWNTPKAIALVLILCLPSTLFFIASLFFAAYVCLKDPFVVFPWILQMGIYWWFFAFMLAMLHPDGIAYRHFNMPKESVETFHKVLKRSVWISALWINASIFTHLETGIPNDVIGQVMTISVLIISLFIIGLRMQSAVKSYGNSAKAQESKTIHWIFHIIRILLVISPIVLTVLVAMGYYYTALNLMDHLMSSYFVCVIWLVLRNVIYRGLGVSSRRLTYQRFKEKREQQALARSESEEELGLSVDLQQNESLGIAQVKDQILRMTDLILMVVLFAMLYWVWADLIGVAYYLQGVTLWQQAVVTETGTVLESITLLNLLLAIIIVMVTYALVRNIGGILEILIFSRFDFSQGTPYTITTLLTYFIIAFGASLAFSTLGMSWSKLQWLFAALSVGLGFGLQAIFANFVSGIIILFERPVRVGDVVTIGEYSGTISKIRIRSTTIIDFDRKEVIIPNQSFVTDRIVNWALNDSVTRVVIQVGVAYGSDLELTKQLLLQAASECDRVLKDPEPVVYFLTFGASTLDHELRLYVGKLSDRNPTVDFLNRRVNELFNQNNIDIAFNQLDVFIKNNTTNEEIKVSETKLTLPN
ncbi:mechanosensitive channel MscK [Pasteurellaceae bacterium 22721_9_1]